MVRQKLREAGIHMKRRLLVKALTWQAMGLVVMSLIGLAFTGSLQAGGGIAISGTIIGFANYILHEKIWERIPWGLNDQGTPGYSSPNSSAIAR